MSVPFWRMFDSKSQLLKILHSYKDEDNIAFNFPLIGDILDHCDFTISYCGIEISPYAIPITKIASFAQAKKRIFMSATLNDDSNLISVFDMNNDVKIITPKRAADIGDRMILFPQAYSPQISDVELKNKILEYSKKINVVVIVPSNSRALFWKDATNNIYKANNISNGIKKINASKNGLYIFINKYDGIDLPDDMCRLIVIDSLPDARSAYDRLKENYFQGSSKTIKDRIQKIEQGMGRGIRSSNDYCGIIIMGRHLINSIYSNNAISFFSVATRKQFEVSTALANDLKNADINTIFLTLEYCLEQNPQWVELSKGALSEILYDKALKIDSIDMVQRHAFNNSILYGISEKSSSIILEIENETEDPLLKGYLMMIRAKYTQFTNPEAAQQILKAAQTFNYHLLKPIEGIKKYRDIKKNTIQSQQIFDMFCLSDVNKYIMDLNAVVDSLVFASNSYKQFEESIKLLGELLGFSASRPDDEYNIGPDALWYLGNNTYFVIECKNEATNDKISKTYCGQLLSATSWFDTEYMKDCKRTPIIIYPTNIFEKSASPADDFRVIDIEKLQYLKSKLKEFSVTLSNNNTFKDIKKLSEALNYYGFTINSFLDRYTKSAVKEK